MKKRIKSKQARPLSVAEEKLWQKVTSDVTAYQANSDKAPKSTQEFERSLENSNARTEIIKKRARHAPLAGSPSQPLKPLSTKTVNPANRASWSLQPSNAISKAQDNKQLFRKQNIKSVLQDGDPKIEKHVRRGRIEIEAVLDLHGSTQIAAQQRLGQFITLARHQKARCVLVITGKGPPRTRTQDTTPFSMDPANSPRGILRNRFLEWVENEPLRSQIIRVATAKPSDGGTGAFYVFLKK